MAIRQTPSHPKVDADPVQIQVVDVRAQSFKSEAHRQSLAVAASAQAADDQTYIDAVSDWGRVKPASSPKSQRHG